MKIVLYEVNAFEPDPAVPNRPPTRASNHGCYEETTQ